jgi:hypothetical protein
MPIPTTGSPTPEDYERITGKAGDLRMPPPLDKLIEDYSAPNQRDFLFRNRDTMPTLGESAEPLTTHGQLHATERRVLTLTIFGKLFVMTRVLVRHELNEPFDALMAAKGARSAEDAGSEEADQPRAYGRAVALSVGWGGPGDLAALRAYQGDPGGRRLVATGTKASLGDGSWNEQSCAELLAWDFQAASSNNDVVVGRAGFEPAISWSQTRRFTGLSHRPNSELGCSACSTGT